LFINNKNKSTEIEELEAKKNRRMLKNKNEKKNIEQLKNLMQKSI